MYNEKIVLKNKNPKLSMHQGLLQLFEKRQEQQRQGREESPEQSRPVTRFNSRVNLNMPQNPNKQTPVASQSRRGLVKNGFDFVDETARAPRDDRRLDILKWCKNNQLDKIQQSRICILRHDTRIKDE